MVVVAVIWLAVPINSQQGGPFAPTPNPLDRILAELTAIEQAVLNLAPVAPQPALVTLSTPVLRRQDVESHTCHLTNVGSTTLADVDIEIISDAGNVLGGDVESVAPGQTSTTQSPSSALARCRFTFVGFAKDVRAVLATEAGGTTAVVEAR